MIEVRLKTALELMPHLKQSLRTEHHGPLLYSTISFSRNDRFPCLISDAVCGFIQINYDSVCIRLFLKKGRAQDVYEKQFPQCQTV